MLQIVVEDGSGKEDANAYCSLEYALAFAQTRMELAGFAAALQAAIDGLAADPQQETAAALKAKQTDASLIDMPVALTAAHNDPSLKVVAQVRAGGEVGIILEKGSPNTPEIDKVVQELLDNGKLKENEEKYYYAAFGGVDPDSLPDWS